MSVLHNKRASRGHVCGSTAFLFLIGENKIRFVMNTFSYTAMFELFLLSVNVQNVQISNFLQFLVLTLLDMDAVRHCLPKLKSENFAVNGI